MEKPKKMYTPWGVDGGSSSRVQAPADYPKYKPAWVHGSSILREEEEMKANMKPYDVKTPWDPEPQDAEDDFDRRMAAENFEFPDAPWDKLQTPVLNNTNATNYKYQSLHEPIPMSASRKAQIENYRMDPPFTTEANENIIRDAPAKAKTVKPVPPTVAPWAYGDLEPIDGPEGKKINARPKDTSLWAIPDSEKPKKPGLESSGDPILDKLRLKLREMGADGIFGLAKKFKIMDDDGSGFLSQAEFNKAMVECKMELTKAQLKHLFRYFDKSDDGSISYDEFLVGIRGVLNARRRAMVQLAFNILDKDQSGVIDMEDVRNVYDTSRHPEVIARKKTKDEVLLEFIGQMEIGADKDGKVTPEEFENYYAAISASIDDDDYFELMIRNAWHISGGEGACANTTNKRVLVTHADGRQTVEEIKNDIGMRKDDKKAMMKNLKAQGISAKRLEAGYGDGNKMEIRDDSVHSHYSNHSQYSLQADAPRRSSRSSHSSHGSRQQPVGGPAVNPSDGRMAAGRGSVSANSSGHVPPNTSGVGGGRGSMNGSNITMGNPYARKPSR